MSETSAIREQSVEMSHLKIKGVMIAKKLRVSTLGCRIVEDQRDGCSAAGEVIIRCNGLAMTSVGHRTRRTLSAGSWPGPVSRVFALLFVLCCV